VVDNKINGIYNPIEESCPIYLGHEIHMRITLYKEDKLDKALRYNQGTI
jgi:hypothetical protein